VVICIVGVACLAFFAKAKRTGRLHPADDSASKQGAALASKLEAATPANKNLSLPELDAVAQSSVANPANESLTRRPKIDFVSTTLV
jgi:hypothetical protein